MNRLSLNNIEITDNSYRLTRDVLYNFGVHKEFGLHTHSFYEFFVLVSGQILHQLNGSRQTLSPGAVVLIHPNDGHCIYTAENCDSATILNCNITTEELHKNLLFLTSGYDLSLDNCPQIITTSPDNPSFKHLLDSLERLLGKEQHVFGPTGSIDCILWRSVLAIVLGLFWNKRFDNTIDYHPEWLVNAITQMQKPENFHVGLKRFHELSGRTLEYLCRSMKRYYGITPQSYVTNLRLHEAASLLIETEQSVTEIGFYVGFNNLSWFRRCFVRKYEVTPHTYRVRMRQS